MTNFPKPKHIPAKEWTEACDRAERAKKYANKMPGFVGPGDARSQDPLWQWENEVKGRLGEVVGGSLSGVSPPKNLNEIPV